MLGPPSIRYAARYPVRTISREGPQGNPHRLHARPRFRVKIQSDLHGDMQRSAEMTDPRASGVTKMQGRDRLETRVVSGLATTIVLWCQTAIPSTSSMS